jgi:sulfite reductase (NADPH) hemoprotein beta-component
MYLPSELDRQIIQDRADQYRDQVTRRLSGVMSEDQFKPLRLMNGLYLQLHAYMLRVAVPFGGYSASQLRALAHIARKYDRHYAHVTTRQNFQFNWIKLSDTPAILDLLAEHGLHAIQTSGSCVRAITVDPYAGFARDEVGDPRYIAEAIRRWTSFHPEFTFLPRKFKIAISGSPEDRSSFRVHDLGIQLIEQDGELGARIFAGGGLGRGPAIGVEVVAFSPMKDVIGWVEAILRVYNAAGRRDHLYKSRIKVLVASLGQDAFCQEVKAAFDLGAPTRPRLDAAEFEAIRKAFQAPVFEAEPHRPRPLHDTSAPALTNAKAYEAWARIMSIAHKVPGYVGVNVSLKRQGGIPGDIDADQMDGLADLAERFSQGELRNTQNQNIILPHVRQVDLPALYAGLCELGLESANIGRASDIVACPGMDYCQLASARSIPLAQLLSERLAASGLDEEAGAVSIKISGCVNACAHHHVADIGILGVDKTDTDYHQIMLGGSAGPDAQLAKVMSKALSTDEAIEAVIRVLEHYISIRIDGEEGFAAVLRRVGLDGFKGAIDGAA